MTTVRARMRRVLWSKNVILFVFGLLAVAFAADLGAAAVEYGPEYVWRLIAWRTTSPHDELRFPKRRIAASVHPVHFPVAPDGMALVHQAFIQIAPAEAQPAETFEQFLARTQTTSLLVLRDGRLLYEGYFGGHQRDTVQTSHSMAKSVTSLLIGAAIAEGKLPSINTPAQDLLPDVKGLRGSGISVRNLLDMTAGFSMDDARPFWPFGAPWSLFRLVNLAPDLPALVAAVRPQYRPGAHFQYDDRTPMLLGMMLENATHEHAAAWLAQRLWQPMGAEFPASWSLDSRASGFEKMESGINARPIDFLKIGQLVLRGGVTERGERLLPESWIKQATAPTSHVAGWTYGDDMFYGLLWWGFSRAEGTPDVFADGIFGQVMLVSRANNVVVLRTGNGEGGVASWPRLLRALANALGAEARG
jgi:CubicO group peptidase (beta-lactamase class C family)